MHIDKVRQLSLEYATGNEPAKARKHKERKNRMLPCSRCLEKNWTYAFSEGVITATCSNCGNEVSFLSKKARRQNQA
jgi:predicted RNA-binding Zn-ribbon protein involved in translation (DUF1610 family)